MHKTCSGKNAFGFFALSIILDEHNSGNQIIQSSTLSPGTSATQQITYNNQSL